MVIILDLERILRKLLVQLHKHIVLTAMIFPIIITFFFKSARPCELARKGVGLTDSFSKFHFRIY